MKFPSFFRIANHKRFNFSARYYDPVKEDIERRTARIQRESSQDQTNNYRSNISNAFTRKPRQSNKSGLIQLTILAVLSTGIFGWIYYGDMVIYFLLGLMGLYFLYRLRGLFKIR